MIDEAIRASWTKRREDQAAKAKDLESRVRRSSVLNTLSNVALEKEAALQRAGHDQVKAAYDASIMGGKRVNKHW